MSPTSSTGAAVRAFWTRGDADLPFTTERGLLEQGLLPGDPAAWPGFRRPAYPDYGPERYGLTANAHWQLASWLNARLTVGSEWASDDDEAETVAAPPAPPQTVVGRRGERRHTAINTRAHFTATYSANSHSGASTLTLERSDARNQDIFGEMLRQGQDTLVARLIGSDAETEISGVDFTQRLELWRRITVTGGARLDRVDVSGTRWVTSPYPHLSVSWAVRPFVPAAFGGVRLRAALGDVGNLPQTPTSFVIPVLGVPEEPHVETTRERQAGVDLEAANRRLGLSATWYVKRTSDVGAVMSMLPTPPRFVTLEVLNRGIEGVLRGTVIATRRVAADVVLRYAYNHNEVRRSEGGQFPVVFDVLHPQIAAVSAPLGAHLYSEAVSMEDLDGDGLFDDACPISVGGCEVLLSPVELRPAFPPTVASLEATVRIGAVTVAALFDHRGGHYRANTTLATRCAYTCRPAYDRRAPAIDQARATAFYSGFDAAAVYVEDASFTKLRELSIRFTAPARWAEALGASRLEVSLAGRNVATWTNYTGLDPEAMSRSWIPLASRDFAAMPVPRRLSFRVTAVRH